MSAKKGLEVAVVDALSSSGIGAIAAEYAELGFDDFVSDGALRDLPFVNSLVAVGRLSLNVCDVLFAKKLVSFLAEIKELSDEERRSMVRRLDQEENFRQRVGERVIEILDRVDLHKKPEMVARVFQAYACLEIDYETLEALIHAIQIIPQHGMNLVELFYNQSVGENFILIPDERKPQTQAQIQSYTSFVVSGLATMTSVLGGGMRYEHTDLCRSFVSIILSEDISQFSPPKTATTTLYCQK